MKIKTYIAIQHRPGSFTDRWLEYCQLHEIKYKVVNCYDNGIIEQLKAFTHLLWPITQESPADIAHARKIIKSAERAGAKVFPNTDTCWHFDDKIAQKYLLEAVGAPLVPSYVFYHLGKSLTWAEQATYPKVFKLKSGAGSANVRLVKNTNEAIKLCQQAFDRGFVSYHGYFGDAKTHRQSYTICWSGF